jgi:hypothetical protein
MLMIQESFLLQRGAPLKVTVDEGSAPLVDRNYVRSFHRNRVRVRTKWKADKTKEKAMSQPVKSQREVKSYRPGLFRSSYQKYEHDLKRHAERHWRLVSCTVAGRDILLRIWLTATYER